jgi:hypothetical protein
MTTVHVEIKFLLITGPLIVYISHEWTSRGSFVSTFRHNKGNIGGRAVDKMNGVVNEPHRAVEFTTGLSANAEDIFSFYGGASGVVSSWMVDSCREGTFAETSDEAEFTWLDFSCLYWVRDEDGQA